MVQPIRDLEVINQIKRLLYARGYKYYIMFLIGINTGLRISDILSLTVHDVIGKSHVVITEKKTGKNKRFLLNEQLKKELSKYMASSLKIGNDYLIPSRKGINRPISRIYAYSVLREIAQQIGLEDIGTHTMRKTFGYWHYKQYRDVAILQEIFNHTSPSITLRYIGITQDEIDDTIKNFFL